MLASSISFRRAPQWMEETVSLKTADIKSDDSMTLKQAMTTKEF